MFCLSCFAYLVYLCTFCFGCVYILSKTSILHACVVHCGSERLSPIFSSTWRFCKCNLLLTWIFIIQTKGLGVDACAPPNTAAPVCSNWLFVAGSWANLAALLAATSDSLQYLLSSQMGWCLSFTRKPPQGWRDWHMNIGCWFSSVDSSWLAFTQPNDATIDLQKVQRW